MLRAAPAAAPSFGARAPATGPVAAADMAAPLTPLEARGGVVTRQGPFSYDTVSADPRQAQARFAEPEPREGGLDSSLFTASSEIFAILFAPHPQYSISPGLPGGANTPAALHEGIERYELVSAVIHDELAPRGERLTITA
jgi:hypothetical protein